MTSRARSWLLLGLIASVAAAGCKDLDERDKTGCEEDDDCLSGHTCIERTCVTNERVCDAFCENACDSLDACGIELDERQGDCLGSCDADFAGRDCSMLEAFDRLTCDELEERIGCAVYCSDLCVRGAQCASIDVPSCQLGCVGEQPQICNPASVPVRSCEQIKVEARDYDLAGRAAVDGDSFQPGISIGGPNPNGLCRAGYECALPLGCDEVTNTCAPCKSDAQCAGGFPRRACIESECTEVGCVKDEDCPGKICELSVHECRDCRQDSDCASGVCDTQQQRCGQCLRDEHCASTSGALAFAACDAAQLKCVQCTEDRHCTALNPDFSSVKLFNACNTEQHRCVQCTRDEHCAEPSSHCEPSVGICLSQ